MTVLQNLTTNEVIEHFGQDILSADYILRNVVPRLVAVSDDNVTKVSFLDLEMQFSVRLSEDENEAQSYRLNETIMERAGLDIQTVKRYALANCRDAVTCRSLSSVIGMGEDEDAPLYVVSVNTNSFGAGPAMLCTDKLHDLAGYLHARKLFVIPSSVHEVLAMPAEADASAVNEMIVSINRSQVMPEERLADHVYIYDAEQDAITC